MTRQISTHHHGHVLPEYISNKLTDFVWRSILYTSLPLIWKVVDKLLIALVFILTWPRSLNDWLSSVHQLVGGDPLRGLEWAWHGQQLQVIDALLERRILPGGGLFRDSSDLYWLEGWCDAKELYLRYLLPSISFQRFPIDVGSSPCTATKIIAWVHCHRRQILQSCQLLKYFQIDWINTWTPRTYQQLKGNFSRDNKVNSWYSKDQVVNFLFGSIIVVSQKLHQNKEPCIIKLIMKIYHTHTIFVLENWFCYSNLTYYLKISFFFIR